MSVNHLIQSYFYLAAETTWGTQASSPAWYHLPILSNGIVMNRERRNSKPFTGIRQAKHGRSFRGNPAGSFSCYAYGWKPDTSSNSLMQMLIDWACSQPEVINQDSKTIHWAEGPDVSNLGWLGMRCNGMTIEGSADSGTVTMTLDVIGKSEVAVATAQAIPNDREKIVEVDFQDCTFSIGGVAQEVRSFRYQIQNGLEVGYVNAAAPNQIAAGELVETVSCNLYKTSDTYNARNRAFTENEETVQITLKGLHNGTGATGTYSVATLLFNRCAFIKPEDSRDKGLQNQMLSWDILKPDSSTASKTISYSEV